MPQTPEPFLQTTVTALIQKMGFEATVTIVSEGAADAKTFYCKAVVAEDQHFLIGQYGVNLAALQHLVRVMARRQFGVPMNVFVDVNEYFAEKRAILEKEAEKAAEEALATRISVPIRPMLPYERKIVHSYLASRPEVTTESVGEGAGRKIMVRPKIAPDEAPLA